MLVNEELDGYADDEEVVIHPAHDDEAQILREMGVDLEEYGGY